MIGYQTITNGPLQREVRVACRKSRKSQKTRFYVFWRFVDILDEVSIILDHLTDLHIPLVAFKS